MRGVPHRLINQNRNQAVIAHSDNRRTQGAEVATAGNCAAPLIGLRSQLPCGSVIVNAPALPPTVFRPTVNLSPNACNWLAPSEVALSAFPVPVSPLNMMLVFGAELLAIWESRFVMAFPWLVRTCVLLSMFAT